MGAAVTAGVMIFATGSGPAGWTCLAVAAALTAGAGGKVAHENSPSSAHGKLKVAIEQISAHMYRVTQELERQCKALQMVVAKLEGACKSTAAIQALVDSWGDEGQGKTKMGALKYKLWLTSQLTKDMAELSDYCKAYLSEETE